MENEYELAANKTIYPPLSCSPAVILNHSIYSICRVNSVKDLSWAQPQRFFASLRMTAGGYSR